MLLSLVVPMYNEQVVLPQFAERARPVLDSLGEAYEVVCVDDGSTDDTAAALTQLAREWPDVRLVRLRRNSGHQAALTAGLEHARGDWVLTMDADLQDPPELIPEMLLAARAGSFDVVHAARSERSSDSWFKRTTAGLYYRIMNHTAGVPVPRHAGDFRLMSAAAVREVTALPERGRVYRLLIPYMGFRSTTLHYSREPRAGGESKYPVLKMTGLAADSYFSFTVAPLRMATWVGAFGFVVCVLFSVAALVAYVTGNTLPGWTSFALVGGFIGAVQFMFLGLIGEYLARIYVELQQRPRYFVDRSDHPSDYHRPAPERAAPERPEAGPAASDATRF